MLYLTRYRLRVWAFFLFILVGSFPLLARDINVRGTVTDSEGEPLYRVSVYNAKTNKLFGTTNEDGKFLVRIDSEGELLFSYMGYKEQTVPVNGELTLHVKLEPTAVVLEEIVVQAKRITDKIIPEPTEIEVKGNYLHVKTRIPIPRELFSTNARVIIQPAIYNVTRKELFFLDPKVFDGKEYAMTQERIHDFDPKQDPLSKFVEVKNTSSRKDDWINYRDSTYVDNMKDEYRCDMMFTIENYNRLLYSDTTVVARGLVNPLRFLEYEILGSAVANESFYPQPEMQLRDSKGDVKLTFKVGRSDLDLSVGTNSEELNRLIQRLQQVENDPDAKLKRFVIAGTASPEGNYARNLQLAQRRMSSAMSFILNEVSESTRKSSEIKSSASVENWTPVVEMLRADGYNEEADAVQKVIDTYSDPNRQSRGVTSLPFYRKLVVPEYLPRLRRVSYELVYSQYRYLTDEEVAELYRIDSSSLSRYEFWRLYTNAATIEEREAVCRKALEVYPKFLVAATDLAAILINQGKPDAELLQPYLNLPEVPNETRLNQVAAWMATGRYTQADSLAALLPDEGVYHKAKVYTAAMNGRYDEVIQEVSESSPLNEVVMLLAIKANEQAWEKAKKLGDSAKEEYIKAVAANRVDDYMPAVRHFENALRKDPSLRDVASVDGDLMDLLKQLEEEKENVYE